MKMEELISPQDAARVAEAFGSWPDLHDAEVMQLKLERPGKPQLTMTLKLIPYDPAGTRELGFLELKFGAIADFTR
jgi:hypothetical protein